ncbi:hypothetical protein MNB_SV-5-1435 [hydrothermal vent metagenome]|uniref:Uncharacterized protein n=1 Tax=hydrothermal vent metagenome TaxID=652676 RepID=A0A1W1EFE3_9ZZZZ
MDLAKADPKVQKLLKKSDIKVVRTKDMEDKIGKELYLVHF